MHYINVKQYLCQYQVLLCIRKLDTDLSISSSLLIAVLSNNDDETLLISMLMQKHFGV